MWIKNVRCLVLFTASVLILLLVLLNLIRKQNRFTLFDNRSYENGINIPSCQNPTEGQIRARAPFKDRSQQVTNKTKNRFADFNSQQFILS